MIPNVIHYCWFGRNPLPELALKCIASWRKYLPDYEIKEWNEDNFDVNIIPYTAEAYRAKKYAFVSDYARFWILYKYGGLYFDTDVEVIRPMDDIIAQGSFMGAEHDITDSQPEIRVAPELGMGAEKGDLLLKELLDYYESYGKETTYKLGTVETVVDKTTKVLNSHGLRNTGKLQSIFGYNIYPKEFFCPMNFETGKIQVSSQTVSIHHYSASWLDKRAKLYLFLLRLLGKRTFNVINSLRFSK